MTSLFRDSVGLALVLGHASVDGLDNVRTDLAFEDWTAASKSCRAAKIKSRTSRERDSFLGVEDVYGGHF